MTAHTTYAPVDHPGTPVPAELRSWDTDHAGYEPVDITPPELRAAALTGDVEGWITDPVATPTQITDWDQRQADAVVPYELNAHGWPLNPTGRTGRTGRNL